jgi:hypothetical protein
MLLIGSFLKKVTSAFGVKPCSGCNSRAAILDGASRRSFLHGVSVLASMSVVGLNDAFALLTNSEASVI